MGQTLKDKAKACPTAAATISPAKPAATCEQQLKDCTADDQKLMSNMFDCQDKLPDCPAGKDYDWMIQVGNCASGLSGLSTACKNSSK